MHYHVYNMKVNALGYRERCELGRCPPSKIAGPCWHRMEEQCPQSGPADWEPAK